MNASIKTSLDARTGALLLALALLPAAAVAQATGPRAAQVRYYDVPKGAHPHDVAADPRPGGPVWYTADIWGRMVGRG